MIAVEYHCGHVGQVVDEHTAREARTGVCWACYQAGTVHRTNNWRPFGRYAPSFRGPRFWDPERGRVA